MSPAGAFSALLDRYGQRVELFYTDGGAAVSCRALIQPLRERKEQQLPTPLGQVRQDRWRYLGDPAVPLEGMEGGYLLWKGQAYEVVTAQPVELGGAVNHWWAILRRRDPDRTDAGAAGTQSEEGQ